MNFLRWLHEHMLPLWSDVGNTIHHELQQHDASYIKLSMCSTSIVVIVWNNNWLSSQWPDSLALSSATSRERENISDNDHQISNRFHCAVKGNLCPDCSVACWCFHLQVMVFEGCQCSNLFMFSKVQQLSGTMSNVPQYKYLLSAVVSGKFNQNVARVIPLYLHMECELY